MRSALVLAAVAALVCGCNAGSKVGADSGIQQEMRVASGLEVGYTHVSWLDGDGAKWESVSYRPYITMGSYGNGLVWDLNARGHFDDKADVDNVGIEGVHAKHSQGDYRYRLGWGFALPASGNVAVLTGPSYRHGRMELIPPSSGGDPTSYQYDMVAWNLGARLAQPLAKRLTLIAEVSADCGLGGTATLDAYSFRLDEGSVLEGRAGLEFGVTQNMLLGAGVFGERARFEYSKDALSTDNTLDSVGLYVGLTARF